LVVDLCEEALLEEAIGFGEGGGSYLGEGGGYVLCESMGGVVSSGSK